MIGTGTLRGGIQESQALFIECGYSATHFQALDLVTFATSGNGKITSRTTSRLHHWITARLPQGFLLADSPLLAVLFVVFAVMAYNDDHLSAAALLAFLAVLFYGA